MALPVNEYLNAVIIIQLSIKLVLLAAWRFFCLSKRSIKKKTPDDAGPAGSPVLLSGTEWGSAHLRIPLQVGDIRMIQKYSTTGAAGNPRRRKSLMG